MPTPSPRPTEAASTPASGGSRAGGTLRHTGFAASDGVFDPHRTQAPPLFGVQSMIYSRLLSYQSQADGIVAADLASSLPERPDAQTFVFQLRREARWDGKPPVGGRMVTAEDVKFSIERQAAGDPSFVRRAQWANIDSLEVISPDTVVVHAAAPLATTAALFAEPSAFIVAPEVAAEGFTAENQLGSGPFRWVEWSEGKFASVARSPVWHGSEGKPYLDGVSLQEPLDASEVEAGLRTKRLDVAVVGRPVAERLRRALPALAEIQIGQAHFFGMRFFLPQVPFNDARFRAGLTYALDRREMIRRFFADSGEVNPWISWPVTRWTLPQAELAAAPGYRPGPAGRAEDLKEAKALVGAAASAQALPAELPLFVVEETEAALKLGSVMRDQLKSALGLPVAVYAVPLAELIRLMLAGQAPWAAGPDSGWIDLDDWVYPYFHTAGTKNSFALRDSELDALIEAQRLELDEPRRREVGLEIQRRLLGVNAGVNFVSERSIALAWPYVKDFPTDISDGYQHRFADCWLDKSNPTFKGR